MKSFRDKILELSKFIADKSRKGTNHYCITDAKNSDFVGGWVKTHSFPINGMFLSKDICEQLERMQNLKEFNLHIIK